MNKMKVNYLFWSLLILFSGCSNEKSSPDAQTSGDDEYERSEDVSYDNDIPDWAVWRKVSVHDEHSIDTAAYQKFQRFDFCRLKGFGTIEKEPYVLVRDSLDFKIIRRSDDLYNIYRFQNMGDHWYNHTAFDPLRGRDNITMSGDAPSDVHRFVQDGKLYEYLATYINDDICVQIRVFSDMSRFLKIKYDYDIVSDEDLEFTYSKEHFNQLKKKINKWRNTPKTKLSEWFWRQNYTVEYNDSCIKERTYFQDKWIVDSMPYSPLGELDDILTMPRTWANGFGWKISNR